MFLIHYRHRILQTACRRLLSTEAAVTQKTANQPVSLKQRVQSDLKSAMLARKQPQSIVLKSILSELTYAEKLKPMSTNSSTQHVTTVSSDEAAMQVLQKMIRKRQDSIEQYRNGQRPDLAAKEQQELELIQTYLPQQMSEGEIKSVVEQVMQRLKIGGGGGGGNSGKQVGLIMKEMRLLMDPARAPPSVVSAVVKEMLSKL